jgi:tRNA isopentenyl-2-thiomethyl-A-37 hydroxylase MiaE
MDKIGERIAFERGGTRLYEALIRKYEVLEEIGAAGSMPVPLDASGDSVYSTMVRICDEEHAHFLMLSEAMKSLGGDPTAQTPCADVVATASLGLLQVVSDPRTTLAQSLSAVLTAELTDNAGWELLIALAEQAGEDDITDRFRVAMVEEEQHLVTIRAWVKALALSTAETPAT